MGIKKRGIPKLRWNDIVIEDLRLRIEEAQDGERWRMKTKVRSAESMGKVKIKKKINIVV